MSEVKKIIGKSVLVVSGEVVDEQDRFVEPVLPTEDTPKTQLELLREEFKGKNR